MHAFCMFSLYHGAGGTSTQTILLHGADGTSTQTVLVHGADGTSTQKVLFQRFMYMLCTFVPYNHCVHAFTHSCII
jgi:hypothetical protein